jgi:hypothetical protein
MSGLVPRRAGWCVILATLWLPVLGAQTADLPPEWEIRASLTSLVEQTQRLKPMLEAAKPEQWPQEGAPSTYQAQWKSIMAEIDYIGRSAGELAGEPERLTLSLNTYFRMQSLDSMLNSLNEGIRKYQNPALADLISGAMTASAAQREKLRQYIVQLAAAKEQQFRVMDQEAQRCRAMLSRQPAAKSSPEKKAETK